MRVDDVLRVAAPGYNLQTCQRSEEYQRRKGESFHEWRKSDPQAQPTKCSTRRHRHDKIQVFIREKAREGGVKVRLKVAKMRAGARELVKVRSKIAKNETAG